MTRDLHFAQLTALLLCFLLVSGAGLMLIVGSASAQETTETTPEDGVEGTETDEAEDESGSDDSNNDESFTHVFDRDNVRIISEHWDGKTYVAEVEAVNRPESITVTDAGRDLTGGVTIDRQSYTISSQGTTEVRFTVVEDREVTVDPGYGRLYGTAPDDAGLTSPDVHTIVSAIIGMIVIILLIIEIARRDGKLSKTRVVKA